MNERTRLTRAQSANTNPTKIADQAGLKNVELVGKISEKLQSLLKQTLESGHTVGQQHEHNQSQAERDQALEGLMRKVAELRSAQAGGQPDEPAARPARPQPATHMIEQAGGVAPGGEPRQAEHQAAEPAGPQPHALDHQLLRHKYPAAPERLRTVSSCSNESHQSLAGHGRASSIGDHCFLEPLDLFDCAASSASSSPANSCSLFSRLTRRLRLLESPSDSGVESGKENGSHSALGFSSAAHLSSGLRSATPTGSSSSACMSPINGLPAAHHQHAHLAPGANGYACARFQRLAAGADQASPMNLISLNAGQQQQPGRPAGQHQAAGRPASALAGQHQARGHLFAGPIEDMPMLKRALQAPPLINTNMLMDEAYRHHKKFRAAQRGREPSSDRHAVCSTSGASSAASTLSGGRAAGSESSSLNNSPAPSPAPSNPPACSGAEHQEAGSGGRASSLADMHSTLLSKLNQPSSVQMSEQRIKCNDLIHEIILRDHSSSSSASNDHHRAQAHNGHQPAAASPVPSGAVAPASSPVSASSSSQSPRLAAGGAHQHQDEHDNKLVGSSLHEILVSGHQKQAGARQQQPAKLQILGGLSHHLVDEDYIAKRLLNSGAYRRHQQQHAHKQTPPAARDHHHSHRHQARHAAHHHHRPSSSCASSSPSPTSSLSTLSPSPSSSMSPDLGMISQQQLAGGAPGAAGRTGASHSSSPSSGRASAMVAGHAQHSGPAQLADQAAGQTSSNQYISQHLSYHLGHQARVTGQLSLVVPANELGGVQQGSSFLVARSPISPISSCDAFSNHATISSTFSSASSSPIPPRLTTATAGAGQSHQLASSLSQISRLSLHCANSMARQADALSSQNLANKLSLLRSSDNDASGNFGLLADVAIAAAEEQSRMELLQQQRQLSAAQPIDLSKK